MKEDWEALLGPERETDSFRRLTGFIEKEYAACDIYPPRDKVFTALERTGYEETKVLILGQDPYHGPRQAHGLSFSVADEAAKFPPSLRNLFKELESDLHITRSSRDLTDWADQGVLLLNSVLTVRAGQAGSHRGKGWEAFTDAVIRLLNGRPDPVIFVLWGRDAQKKLPLITGVHHKIIAGVHPSPLSARNGFFGSRPFSQINRFLNEIGKNPVVW